MPAVLAALLVFFASAAVLVLEILAGRLLAPYVGVTLESFTGIIGVILAGIALGAWVGGRLADRHDPRRLLGPLLVIGGTTAFLSIPIVDALGSGMRGARPSVIVILALAGFFAPAAVLSAVTPTVVKLRLRTLEETGSVVGRLSAIGTAGALVGTFATGFVLVAAWPTRPIIRVLGGILVVGGIAVWYYLVRSGAGRPGLGTVAFVALAAAGSFAAAHPCEYESAYYCAFITEDPDRPSGRTLWLDTLRHSYVDLEDPTHLEFTYAQTLSDVLAVVAPQGAPVDALHIGGGGLTLPRYLREARPGTTSTVLELDPTLVEIAARELRYEPGPDITIRTGDARVHVAEVPDGSQDVAIGDAFGGISVPWHLTTREFLTAVDGTLRPDGIYAINLIDYPPLGFARAEAATLAAVFEHVAVVAPPGRLRGDRGGNMVLLASQQPLPLAAILERNGARGDDEEAVGSDGFSSVEGVTFASFVGDAEVLTDDHAPVDQLLTPYPPPR